MLKPRTRLFKKNAITAKTVSQLKCLEEREKMRETLQVKDLVLELSAHTWDTFLVAMLATNLEWCWHEKTSQARFRLRHCPHTFFHDIHGPDWKQYRWRHENPTAALLSFLFKAQSWRYYNQWTVRELSDIPQPAVQTTPPKFFS